MPRPFLIHYQKCIKDRKKSCDETNMNIQKQSTVEFYINKLDRQNEACDQKEKLISTFFY